MSVHSHTLVGCRGAGKAVSSDSSAVSGCTKPITTELLRAAKELHAFGANRSDCLESYRKGLQSFSLLVTALRLCTKKGEKKNKENLPTETEVVQE